MLVITGLSGAGKTKAIQVFEDYGFYCVDNMPPALMPKFAELCMQSEGKIKKVAVVIDIRGRTFFESAVANLDEMKKMGIDYKILYLEASDDILVRRFKETRRRHPLAYSGNIIDGISRERRLLRHLRGMANKVIDTTNFSNQQLREEIISGFLETDDTDAIVIRILSFGYKYGLPIDADNIFDVRFLPNPYYIPELKLLTGIDPAVKDYVISNPLCNSFLDKLFNLLEMLILPYKNEGKTHLTIAIGCTGGRHRSVAIANNLYEKIASLGYQVQVEHRDCEKDDYSKL